MGGVWDWPNFEIPRLASAIFSFGDHIERKALSNEVTGRLDDAIKQLTDHPAASNDDTLVETFLATPSESTTRLRHRARELER